MDFGKTIGVLGIGGWGIAIASHWARLGYTVKLWCFEDDAFVDMKQTGSSGPFLTGIKLPSSITLTQNFSEIFNEANLIFECIPTLYLRNMMEQCKPFFDNKRHIIISTSKGVEADTFMFSTEIISDVLDKETKQVFFAGMNSAIDLAEQNHSSAIMAARQQDLGLLIAIKDIMDTFFFKLELSLDLKGVLISVAFKNLIAIVMGVLQGIGIPDNIKSFFMNRCLKEIAKVIKATGGEVDTILGLSFDYNFLHPKSPQHAKKFELGCLLGKGVPLDELKNGSYVIPEGISVLISIIDFAQSLNINLPICIAVKDYLISGYSVDLFERAQFLINLEYEELRSQVQTN